MAKRGRKPKEKKGYFEENEEQAIISFINETDLNKKNYIYNTKLMPAFEKMIESIIRRYKLYVPDEEFEETFADTLSYLMTKINNFNQNKGAKAYSYCGTVCKNYLIAKNIQYTKNTNRLVSYEYIKDGLSNNIILSENKSDSFGVDNAEKLISTMVVEITKMINDRDIYGLTDEEIIVGEAIIDLLNNWEQIVGRNDDEDDVPDELPRNYQYKTISNKLQKSKILYFLREETMMSTKEVRDNMKKFKLAYLNTKRALQE